MRNDRCGSFLPKRGRKAGGTGPGSASVRLEHHARDLLLWHSLNGRYDCDQHESGVCLLGQSLIAEERQMACDSSLQLFARVRTDDLDREMTARALGLAGQLDHARMAPLAVLQFLLHAVWGRCGALQLVPAAKESELKLYVDGTGWSALPTLCSPPSSRLPTSAGLLDYRCHSPPGPLYPATLPELGCCLLSIASGNATLSSASRMHAALGATAPCPQ